MSAYFKYLVRTYYFRVLLTAYAFFVFFGVMPKAPPRGPFQSPLEHMVLTVTNSLGGLIALAVLLGLVLAIWAAIAASRGHAPPSEKSDDGARS